MPIDFTSCEQNPYKVYGGANGSKLGILYEGAPYMLKFPAETRFSKEMSYSNGTVSEYISCHVYQLLGILVQDTLLGTYTHKGKQKIVVACKDLEQDGYRLKDFASLKNTIIDSARGGYGTELSEILLAIDEQQLVSPLALKKFFWDMFVVDALLGNFDRHNGNWGFLINEELRDVRISPVFDCGSCLFPEMDEKLMQRVMEDTSELEHRLYVMPKSAVMQNDKKIGYFDYLRSGQNADCTASLMDIASRIDEAAMNAVIDETPLITETEKAFYKFMLKQRNERILQKAVQEIDMAPEKAKKKRRSKESER